MEAIERAGIPIANPTALAAAASLSLPDARAALDSLAKVGLIDWQPAQRGKSGIALSDATWAVTARGRAALAGSS